MESKTKSRLLQQAIEGDEQSLGRLLQDYRPYLRILARRHLDSAVASRVDPSDLVQQACLEVHRDITSFRGEHEREFLAWIRRILENSARDSVQMHITAQKRSVHRERSIDARNEPAPTLEFTEPVPSPSSRAMRDEMALRLAAEVEGLPDDQREAVRLRHLEGRPLKDLARHFGRSESAVAGLLKRGLRTLRERLADIQ